MPERRTITSAQRDLESAILTLRHHFKVSWTDECFHSLYYLVRKARRVRKEAGR